MSLDSSTSTGRARTLHHVVMWQLKDPARAPEFQKLLLSCRDLVAGILSFEVGIRDSALEANLDVVLIARYQDADALKAYATHPHHLSVVAQLGPLREHRHVLDYWA